MKTRYLFPLVILSVSAHAAPDCPDLGSVDRAGDPPGEFEVLRFDNKLGDLECDTDLCNAIKKWERKAPSDEKTTQAASLLDAIRASASKLSTDKPGVATLNNRLDVWREQLSEANVADLPTAEWQADPSRIFSGQEYEISIEEIFREQCAETVSSCNEVFDTTACVYSHVVMQRRVLLELLETNREATIKYLERLNSRWSAFNNGGRSLFPWELWANGAIQARKGSPRGFVEPPTYQIAMLHPSIGVTGEDSSDGDLQVAVVLEVIGWYGWRWGGRDGATMKRPLGGSLILAWDGSNEASYGVMIHLPKNWSIGAIQKSVNGNTQTTLILSVDLGKFFTDEGRLRQNLIDEIKPALKF
jgi:hypothetical protein